MDSNTFDLFTLESFRARRDAMNTQNRDRESRGEPQAYADADFFALEREILEYRNSRG